MSKHRYPEHKKYESINNIENINQMRESLGMRLIKENKRQCMTCDKMFMSHGPQHRMCRDCRVSKGGRIND